MTSAPMKLTRGSEKVVNSSSASPRTTPGPGAMTPREDEQDGRAPPAPAHEIGAAAQAPRRWGRRALEDDDLGDEGPSHRLADRPGEAHDAHDEQEHDPRCARCGAQQGLPAREQRPVRAQGPDGGAGLVAAHRLGDRGQHRHVRDQRHHEPDERAKGEDDADASAAELRDGRYPEQPACAAVPSAARGTKTNPTAVRRTMLRQWIPRAARSTCPIARGARTRCRSTGDQRVRRVAPAIITPMIRSVRLAVSRVEHVGVEPRPLRDGGAEEAGDRDADHVPGRDRDRRVPQLALPVDRRGPLLVGVRPVGALKSPAFWPQLPSNASQASAASGPLGSPTTRTSGTMRCDGPVVSSQPNPSLALRPSQSWMRSSSRATRRPGRRPGGCHRARACRRPSPPARRRRAGSSRPRPAPGPAPPRRVDASKTSWIISQSPSCRSLNWLK